MARRKSGVTTVPILDADSLYRQRYFVPKCTGTSSDVLLTYGFAAIVAEIGRQAAPPGGFSVRIVDSGSWYEVLLSQALQREWAERCRCFSIAKAIRKTKTELGELPKSEVEDYDLVWQRIKANLDTGDTETGAVQSDAAAAQQDLARVNPQDWVAVYIGARQMQALSTYNQVVLQWWVTEKYFALNVKALLALFQDPAREPNTVAAAWRNSVPARIKTEVTASQMLNAHQGKGQNQPKANALKMDNVTSFWLLEYLKAVGMWQCCAPRLVKENSGDGKRKRAKKKMGSDYKTYVLAPIDISLSSHISVFRQFGDRLWRDTAVRMDCVASLLYTDLLLQHTEAGQYDELADLLRRKPLKEVVAGFHVTQYKMLSRNAYTMINVGFVELPTWIRILSSPYEVRQIRGVIEEHHAVLRGIDEGRSDGYALLTLYRSFLSSGRWDDFFSFAGGFAAYLMRELNEARRQKRAPRQKSLSTSSLEVMLMQDNNKTLLSIVQNSEFRNIATAIRKSTVTLQYLYMSRNEERSQPAHEIRYEIRYGLAQELLRKANRKDEFIQALAIFAQSYNAENARVAEQAAKQKKKDTWRREAITDRDLGETIRLVEDYGAETVARLLVAYGYAREAKDEALAT